jgi:hypothetical protein
MTQTLIALPFLTQIAWDDNLKPAFTTELLNTIKEGNIESLVLIIVTIERMWMSVDNRKTTPGGTLLQDGHCPAVETTGAIKPDTSYPFDHLGMRWPVNPVSESKIRRPQQK